ncbi:MAG: hypothetical protein R3C60_13175 [Parvularculaceae bacterium]
MEERLGDSKLEGRIVGAVMAAASVLTVVFMAHHPTSRDQVALAPPVHGALMILILIAFTGYLRFCMLRGTKWLAILAGLVAFGVGTIANLLAATINGFAVPALVERNASDDLYLLSWELNQALAYEGAYAVSAAFILWGADMLARERGLGRLIGAAGIIAGTAPAFLLATGAIDMHVAGALIVYSTQAAFGVIISLWMMRGSA